MMMKLCRWLAVTLLLSLTLTTTAASFENNNVDRFVNQFIDEMVKKHQFKKEQLEAWFSQIQIDEIVKKKMSTPYEAQPWHRYSKHFLTDQRIKKGVTYWNAHRKTLTLAEDEFGVPASVIVAILGVETNYGDQQGSFNVLQSLATLAFNYPSRAKFFKKELREFLLLTREQEIDPLSVNGSYAGAIGMPQFMPSSYRHYALKFTGNKHLDLTKHHHDAIGSVANYLHKHHWITSQPIALHVTVNGDKYKPFIQSKIRGKYQLSQLTKAGVKIAGAAPKSKRYMLFSYEQKDSFDYWLGFDNFYVIARYNNSKAYVLAVAELSRAIEEAAKKHAKSSNA